MILFAIFWGFRFDKLECGAIVNGITQNYPKSLQWHYLKQKENERMSLLQFAGLVIAVTFILYAAWRIGFEDGRRMTMEEWAMTIQKVLNEQDAELQEDYLIELSEDDGDKHVVTYADLAALEEAQRQKEQKEKGADK